MLAIPVERRICAWSGRQAVEPRGRCSAFCGRNFRPQTRQTPHSISRFPFSISPHAPIIPFPLSTPKVPRQLAQDSHPPQRHCRHDYRHCRHDYRHSSSLDMEPMQHHNVHHPSIQHHLPTTIARRSFADQLPLVPQTTNDLLNSRDRQSNLVSYFTLP